jgi:hypothetical protein
LRRIKEEILQRDDELERNTNVVGISIMLYSAYDGETNALLRKRVEPEGPLNERVILNIHKDKIQKIYDILGIS